MHVTVISDGKTYQSKEDPTMEKSELNRFLVDFYDLLPNMTKFKMELKDGGILMLPKDAVQRAHFIFNY